MNQVDNYSRIEQAIHFIKNNYQNQPSLDEIADHINLSKFHFQRIFQEWAGVSPKAFLQYITVQHAKQLLVKGQSTLQTSHEVGLSETGRLHDLFVKIDSVRPGQFKDQGRELVIKYNFHKTVFGEILIAETDYGICNLNFIKDKSAALDELKSFWPNAKLIELQSDNLVSVKDFFNAYKTPSQKIVLDLKGTPFQMKVWEALLKIPSGELVSYADLANYIGQPKASRAVGTAIGKNPIAFLIPCHRVIRQVGEIGEYRWGSTRKSAIIGWESSKNLA